MYINNNNVFIINLKCIKHLCFHLNFPIEKIKYYCKEKDKHAKELTLIQMKDGKRKERIVYNPSTTYKILLRKINKNLLSKAILPSGVLGGLIGKKIDDMIKIHLGKEYVFSMDIKNFYPSIESGRIFNLFLNSGCTHEISGILTDLVTLHGSLPQGYPTSTMLANLAAVGLDKHHIEICKEHNLSRTRWIDDIIISGRTKDIEITSRKIIGAFKANKFNISNKKTKAAHRSENPTVLGLHVGKHKPKIPEVVISKIKDILLECKENGVRAVQNIYETDAFGRRKKLEPSLRGKIRYIERYNEQDGKELMELFNDVFKKID